MLFRTATVSKRSAAKDIYNRTQSATYHLEMHGLGLVGPRRKPHHQPVASKGKNKQYEAYSRAVHHKKKKKPADGLVGLLQMDLNSDDSVDEEVISNSLRHK